MGRGLAIGEDYGCLITLLIEKFVEREKFCRSILTSHRGKVHRFGVCGRINIKENRDKIKEIGISALNEVGGIGGGD